MSEFQHQTVLCQEAIEQLNIRPDGIYVDATTGGAGHAFEIASRLSSSGTLIGIDQDQSAIDAARERLAGMNARIELIRQNFSYLTEIIERIHITGIDGILFDLGVSSPQLDQEERGFSYKHDAPLDMRMDRTQPFSAFHLVNATPKDELAKILWIYGEERWAKRIAQFIDDARHEKTITTTGELVEIIKEAIPASARREGPHPAKRSFQAIRIAVNRELEVLESALKQAIELLNPQGRLVAISFHSLEDRLVKSCFAEAAKGCECPKDIPICICNRKPKLKIITKKPILPNVEELKRNPRARSSKLRTAEKLV
jgi:16S rRNA (cytosine1402-N4)-methyltransferase